MAGIKMTHVPYRGGGGPMTDLLGGSIDLNVDTITVIEPQLRAGKVTALGVTSGKKWWSLPDIGPIAAAVPGYDVQTWLGLAAPKGTPAAIVGKLNAAVRGARRTGTGEVEQDRRLDVHPARRMRCGQWSPSRSLSGRRSWPTPTFRSSSVSREWRRSRRRSQRCGAPFRRACAHQPLALKPEHLVFSPQPEGSPEGHSRLLAG